MMDTLMFDELANSKLISVTGGGVLMGLGYAVVASASASIAVVSAISVPFGSGLAGASVAAGSGLAAKACFEVAMSELKEGTLF